MKGPPCQLESERGDGKELNMNLVTWLLSFQPSKSEVGWSSEKG